MRFKAKLVNDQLSLFLNVISPISKLQDSHRFAVIYLDKEYVRISCKTAETGITCLAELVVQHLFIEHRIESAADNVIVCQVDLVSFKLALQSVVHISSSGGGGYRDPQQQQRPRRGRGDGANTSVHGSALQSLLSGQPVVILKLAKRHNNIPCLCLEGRHTSDKEVEIHQAIPVRILRREEMQNHLPPQINHPQVQLELPDDRPIRAVIDRLKAMSNTILLEGNMKGDLTIRIDHGGASLACFYNQLIPRWMEQEDDQENDNDGNSKTSVMRGPPNINASCTIKVDAHKFSTCLQWQQSQLPTTSCLLGMVYNEMLVMHVLLAPEQVGFFTYYLPVHFLSEEDLA
jgi:HUS1 checkpoint protein